uniref:Uncharacterized protein n=1 Tax=Oryza glumipatula TaxID=40148 RepID=A0A0E0AJQ5_9ORYZ
MVPPLCRRRGWCRREDAAHRGKGTTGAARGGRSRAPQMRCRPRRACVGTASEVPAAKGRAQFTARRASAAKDRAPPAGGRAPWLNW